MTEQVFLKAEYETTEVKEECEEKNYEMFTETLNAKGKKTWKHTFCLIHLTRYFKNMQINSVGDPLFFCLDPDFGDPLRLQLIL